MTAQTPGNMYLPHNMAAGVQGPEFIKAGSCWFSATGNAPHLTLHNNPAIIFIKYILTLLKYVYKKRNRKQIAPVYENP